MERLKAWKWVSSIAQCRMQISKCKIAKHFNQTFLKFDFCNFHFSLTFFFTSLPFLFGTISISACSNLVFSSLPSCK